jgi:hypothetical protein
MYMTCIQTHGYVYGKHKPDRVQGPQRNLGSACLWPQILHLLDGLEPGRNSAGDGHVMLTP